MVVFARLSVLAVLPLVMLCLALGPGASEAGTLRGVVLGADGRPVAAAMVTLADAKRGIAESVFTDSGGRFALVTQLSGMLELRIRKPYRRDVHETVTVPVTGTTGLRVAMQEMSSAAEISESLPALFHFGRISFQPGTPFNRSDFQRDCLTCHQLGNEFTRKAMPPAAWEAIVKQMHAWLGNFDPGLRVHRAELLAKAFDGTPLRVRPSFPSDPALRTAKITEYRLERAVVPHDAEVNPHDGLVYTVDEGADQMIITDLGSGQTRYVPEPADGSPVGGKFGLPLLFNMAVTRGPHSLALGRDGKYYVTDAFAGAVAVFDPARERWEPPHDAGAKALYPHTIRVDHDGIAWFTVAYSDQIGRFDPKSGRIDLIAVPARKPLGTAAVTVPYGIDVDPLDGTVWYARLFADRIGRIDPHTLAITEFDSPVKGPRRMRFDKHGVLWVAGFSDGELARIETSPFKARVYKLPQFAPGYPPAPYALAVEPRTQEIWISEAMTDHIFRFQPRTGRFIAYPMPLRGTYTRELSFTADGRVCMSNNPVPKITLEGGVLELVCIDPAASRTPR